MPYLDWGDQGGFTTLSYEDTMACIGRFLKTEGHRDLPFLGRLPSDGVLSRLWQSIMGAVQDKSASTFGIAMERIDVAAATLPVATFVIADTEWIECEDPSVGHLTPAADAWGVACRWLPAATVGDFYGDGSSRLDGSRAAADFISSGGGYFRNAMRGPASGVVRLAKLTTARTRNGF